MPPRFGVLQLSALLLADQLRLEGDGLIQTVNGPGDVQDQEGDRGKDQDHGQVDLPAGCLALENIGPGVLSPQHSLILIPSLPIDHHMVGVTIADSLSSSQMQSVLQTLHIEVDLVAKD